MVFHGINGVHVQIKFANALVHMASNKVKTGIPGLFGVKGEIRKNCRFTNEALAAMNL